MSNETIQLFENLSDGMKKLALSSDLSDTEAAMVSRMCDQLNSIREGYTDARLAKIFAENISLSFLSDIACRAD